jgi:hypothetical protein
VKRLSADDSAGSRVKVGHRQALTAQKTPVSNDWGFLLWEHQRPEKKKARTSRWRAFLIP